MCRERVDTQRANLLLSTYTGAVRVGVSVGLTNLIMGVFDDDIGEDSRGKTSNKTERIQYKKCSLQLDQQLE
jgi:hypothetical protein